MRVDRTNNNENSKILTFEYRDLLRKYAEIKKEYLDFKLKLDPAQDEKEKTALENSYNKISQAIRKFEIEHKFFHPNH